MDLLRREHEFVQKIWLFVKACNMWGPKEDSFWRWQQDEAEKLAAEYSDVPFATGWLIAFQKSLEK